MSRTAKLLAGSFIAVMLATAGIAATSAVAAPLHRYALRSPRQGLGLQFIRNRYNHQCLGIRHGSNTAGAIVAMGTCSSSHADMIWNIQFHAGGGSNSLGVWTATNNYSHFCLTFANNSYANRTALIQWWCDSNSGYDQLTMEATDSTHYIMGHGSAGNLALSLWHVVEDPGFSTTLGTAVDEWDENGGNNQQWSQ